MRLFVVIACSVITLAAHAAQPPSAILDFSAAFVSAIAERPSETVKPVRDCILGTSIHGTGLTRARSRLDLIPDPDRMAVDLVVAGQTWTDTVGTKGPVFVFNDRETAFEVRQRVTIDSNGVSLEPPCARAKGESELRCLTTKYRGLLDRLIKPFALRRYQRNKDEASQIADRHAEEKYEHNLAEDTDRRAKTLTRRIERGLEWLAAHDVQPGQLHIRTLPGSVQATAAIWPAEGLAVVAPPPSVDGADVTARAHQAAVNHFVRPRLAGRTITERGLWGEFVSLLRRAPWILNNKDNDDPEWSLTLDRAEPVAIRFVDGRVEATFKVAEIAVGEDVYPAMDVTASYEFRPNGARLSLRRVGKVQAYPAGYVPGRGNKLSARQVAVRSVVEKQLNQSAPERFDLPDLPLSGELERLGSLRVVRLDPRGGWLLAVLQCVTPAPSRTDP